MPSQVSLPPYAHFPCSIVDYLQGSFGPFGPKSEKVSTQVPGASRPQGPKKTEDIGKMNFSRVFGNGPNTVWESTVSNSELSELFFGPH